MPRNDEMQHASDDDIDANNVPSRGTALRDDRGDRAHGSPYVSPAVRSSLVNSRESTPTQSRHRVTMDSLLRRPRSNPRTRTPMRYESPLSPQAFRRDDPSPERAEEQRATVRPIAGASIVGTTLGARRIRELREGRSATPLSSKQGPSRRKVNRWNNDTFSGIASEIAKASSRGAATAEILMRAQADAPLYISVYNPDDSPESTVSKFMFSDDANMKGIREEFFEGEIGYGRLASHSHINKAMGSVEPRTPDEMLKRIPERLRNVIFRACSSSETTAKLVDFYEAFLVQCFGGGKSASLDATVPNTLLKTPTVTKTNSGSIVARFCFDSKSSEGGFHRLLLHAVCQFHSLQAISTTTELKPQTARLLSVTGTLLGPKVRLSQVIRDTKSELADVPGTAKALSSIHL